MSDDKKNFSKEKAYWIFPICFFVFLCIVEWSLWIFTPEAFFYTRGRNIPNLNYTTNIHGDLSADNIFITPVNRKFHFETDKYGSRNSKTVQSVDILLLGQSFSYGGGTSQEDSPASQLERISGKSVAYFSSSRELSEDLSQFEKAAYIIKYKKPISPKVLVFDIVDTSLADSISKEELFKGLTHVVNNSKEIERFSILERFQQLKINIRKWSPVAIICRKVKTFTKRIFLKSMYALNIYSKSGRSMEYLSCNGKTSGFLKLPLGFENLSLNDDKMKQFIDALVFLNDYARKNNITFIVSIIPSKTVAYSKYLVSNQINGFGPAQILYDELNKRGIYTLLYHQQILAAVDHEMLDNGPSVYWSDDTHWGPLGINIAMHMLTKKLEEIDFIKRTGK